MLTKSDVERLGAFGSRRFLATTLYLPLDLNKPPQFPVLLRDMIREAEEALERAGREHEVKMAARRDLERLERFVTLEIERSAGRGMAVAAFACSGEDFWYALQLPMSLAPRLVQESSFYVRPLASVLDQYRPIMLALIDRRRARLFRVQLTEAHEVEDIASDVPSKVREGGFEGYATKTIERHIADHVRRHFERVAQALFEAYQSQGFDWLVLGGQEPNLSEFTNFLHPYLRERLRATLTMRVEAPLGEVLATSRQLERRLKLERDGELVRRVQEGLFPEGWAVSGPAETLQLLAQGRVHQLLVRPGFSRPGLWCPDCRLLLPDARECPLECGGGQPVNDVIDEAVAFAYQNGIEVAHVEHEAMERLGNVAAILRYARKELTSG